MIRRMTVSRTDSLSSWCVVFLGLFFTWLTLLKAEARSWKYLSELSEEERRNIDPRTDSSRHATLPYLPAEPYLWPAGLRVEQCRHSGGDSPNSGMQRGELESHHHHQLGRGVTVHEA
jgi:hypothetical protein